MERLRREQMLGDKARHREINLKWIVYSRYYRFFLLLDDYGILWGLRRDEVFFMYCIYKYIYHIVAINKYFGVGCEPKAPRDYFKTVAAFITCSFYLVLTVWPCSGCETGREASGFS